MLIYIILILFLSKFKQTLNDFALKKKIERSSEQKYFTIFATLFDKNIHQKQST